MFIKLRNYNGKLNELPKEQYTAAKAPMGKTNWKENQYTAEQVKDIKSVGFVPPKGYVVVDCDDMKSVKLMEIIMGNLKTTQRKFANETGLSWGTKKGRHYLFKTDNENIKSNTSDNVLNSKFDLKGNGAGYLVISERINPKYIEKYIKDNENTKNIPNLPFMLEPIDKAKPKIDFYKYPIDGERDDTFFKEWLPELARIYKNDSENMNKALLGIMLLIGGEPKSRDIENWAKKLVKQQLKSNKKIKKVTVDKDKSLDTQIVTQTEFKEALESHMWDLEKHRNRFVVYYSELYYYDISVRLWLNYDNDLKSKGKVRDSQVFVRIKELITEENVKTTIDGKGIYSHNKAIKAFLSEMYNPKYQIKELEKSVVALNVFIDKDGDVRTIDNEHIPPFTTNVIPHNISLSTVQKPALLHKLDKSMFGSDENIDKIYDVSSFYISNYSSGLFIHIKGLGSSGIGTRQELHKAILGANAGKMDKGIYVGGSNQFSSSVMIGLSLVFINELFGKFSNKGIGQFKELVDTAGDVYAEKKNTQGQTYPNTASQEGGGNSVICVPVTHSQLLERLVLVLCKEKKPLTNTEYYQLKKEFKKCVDYMLFEYFKRQRKFIIDPIYDRNTRFKVHNTEYIEEMKEYDGLGDFISKLYKYHNAGLIEMPTLYTGFTPKEVADAYKEFNSCRSVINSGAITEYLKALNFNTKTNDKGTVLYFSSEALLEHSKSGKTPPERWHDGSIVQ